LIVRVLRFRVSRHRIAQFNAIMRRQLALLREQGGLDYVRAARRIQPDGGAEAILFEEWRDAASLYAWVGPDLAEPRLVPGAREQVDDLTVTHYELLADASDEPLEAVDVSRG
jgi:hypothetical protein